MRFLLAILALLVGGDDFTKFKVNTTWTYEREMKVTDETGAVRDEKGSSVIKVVKNEANKMICEVKDNHREDTVSFALVAEDNSLKWCHVQGENIVPMFNIFKFDAAAGDSWDALLVPAPFEAKTKFVGRETLKVPAGEYKDVVHVQVTMDLQGQKVVLDYYFMPKVGMLKMAAQTPEGNLTVSLKEFKEAQ